MAHKTPCIVCVVHQPTARLENYTLLLKDSKGNPLMVGGDVFGDVHKRWEDGTWIRTSQVVEFDEESGHVKTLNSLYILGKKSEKPYV